MGYLALHAPVLTARARTYLQVCVRYLDHLCIRTATCYERCCGTASASWAQQAPKSFSARRLSIPEVYKDSQRTYYDNGLLRSHVDRQTLAEFDKSPTGHRRVPT